MPDTPITVLAGVTRRRAARTWARLATFGALLAVAAPASAQRATQARAGVAWTPMAVGPRPTEPGDGVMPTRKEWRLMAVMPIFGAAGAQLLGSPSAWERTWAGYGYRLGDQVGFLIVEEGLKRGLRAAIGPAAPARSCWRDDRAWLAALAQGTGCAIASTFVERSPGGGHRLNVPTVVSVLGATGVSLAWRPERTNAAKAQSFLLVRTGIVFGGLSASRLFDDWRERDARRGDESSSPEDR